MKLKTAVERTLVAENRVIKREAESTHNNFFLQNSLCAGVTPLDPAALTGGMLSSATARFGQPRRDGTR